MNEIEVVNIEVELLIEAIYCRYHYDFRHYSRTSIRRRLSHALGTFKMATISELQTKLLYDENFFRKLLRFLTVNTTEFFRDPLYFEKIREEVFGYLKTFPSIKIWIAGCSTGEEVLSFSILLREAGITKYLIYATDLDPANLDIARKGIYSIDAIREASRNYQLSGGKESLSDYYVAAFDYVKFDPELLKNVVFFDHSLATDEVFSETQFISCRNVLIYFDRKLQERAFRLFSSSLMRHGFLGLGPKESMLFSKVKNDFKVIDQMQKIFQKI